MTAAVPVRRVLCVWQAVCEALLEPTTCEMGTQTPTHVIEYHIDPRCGVRWVSSPRSGRQLPPPSRL